jgi:outer membrane protein assembly factor BamB
MLDDGTFVTLEDDQLVGINVQDGSVRWSQPVSVSVVAALLDADRALIYTVDLFGRVEAWRISDQQVEDAAATAATNLAPLWEIKLDGIGHATLMPHPGGGVVVSFLRDMFGVSPTGKLLWKHDDAAQVFDWALTEDALIVSAAGRSSSLWTIDASGPTAWAMHSSGRPVVVGDQTWVYAADGVYRLDSASFSVELLYALPFGSPWLGDMIALPDGNVLLTHIDRFDARLIALNGDGTLRWERSFSSLTRGQQRLLMLDGGVVLMSQDGTGSVTQVSLFAIDLNSAELTRIFTAFRRSPGTSDAWAHALSDDRLLISTGDSGMAVLDTQLALEAVAQTMGSQ